MFDCDNGDSSAIMSNIENVYLFKYNTDMTSHSMTKITDNLEFSEPLFSCVNSYNCQQNFSKKMIYGNFLGSNLTIYDLNKQENLLKFEFFEPKRT